MAMREALARSFSHAICLSARSRWRRCWASWKTLVASGSSRFSCRLRTADADTPTWRRKHRPRRVCSGAAPAPGRAWADYASRRPAASLKPQRPRVGWRPPSPSQQPTLPRTLEAAVLDAPVRSCVAQHGLLLVGSKRGLLKSYCQEPLPLPSPHPTLPTLSPPLAPTRSPKSKSSSSSAERSRRFPRCSACVEGRHGKWGEGREGRLMATQEGYPTRGKPVWAMGVRVDLEPPEGDGVAACGERARAPAGGGNAIGPWGGEGRSAQMISPLRAVR